MPIFKRLFFIISLIWKASFQLLLMDTKATSRSKHSWDSAPVRYQIGIPKPLKKDRLNLRRKKAIKKLDRKVAHDTESLICAKCGAFGKTDPAHIIPRRYLKFRHDPKNINRHCRLCHQKEKYSKEEQRIRILHSDPTLWKAPAVMSQSSITTQTVIPRAWRSAGNVSDRNRVRTIVPPPYLETYGIDFV